jgi:hypothetical protein
MKNTGVFIPTRRLVDSIPRACLYQTAIQRAFSSWLYDDIFDDVVWGVPALQMRRDKWPELERYLIVLQNLLPVEIKENGIPSFKTVMGRTKDIGLLHLAEQVRTYIPNPNDPLRRANN